MSKFLDKIGKSWNQMSKIVWNLSSVLLNTSSLINWRWRTTKHNWIRHSQIISNISYNKRQQDAQFLKFILINNSTCFGKFYCPSSRVTTLYRKKEVFVMLVVLTVSVFHPDLASRQSTEIVWQILLAIQFCYSWWWTVDLSWTSRVIYQNKFEKFCISLSLI